jgi:hypothetical protein
MKPLNFFFPTMTKKMRTTPILCKINSTTRSANLVCDAFIPAVATFELQLEFRFSFLPHPPARFAILLTTSYAALATPIKGQNKKKRPSPLKDTQSQKKRSKNEFEVARSSFPAPVLPSDEIHVTELSPEDRASLAKASSKRARHIPESTGRREKPRRDSSLNSIALQWTHVEQNSFEEGLVLFGRPNWKQIATVVGTKNAMQVKAYYKYYSNLHGEEYIPAVTEERLQALRVKHAGIRIPKKPGRKPKNFVPASPSSVSLELPSRPNTPTVFMRSNSMVSESISFSSPSSPMSESSSSDVIEPSTGRRKKVSGEVIVLTAAEEDEAEIVDIDFDSDNDHASIDADDGEFHDEDSDDSSSSDSVFTLAVAVAAGAIPSPFARSQTPPPISVAPVAPLPVSVAPMLPIPTGPSITPPSTTIPATFSTNAFWSQEWLDEIDIPPSSVLEVNEDEILDIEMRANSEFFEGNNVKTPERYVRIRNHIVGQWQNDRSKYVTKTSVRRGLRDCGDVNAIGRVHQFLELVGAINFGLEAPASCRKQGQETPAGAVAEAVARLGSNPTRKANSASALKRRVKLCGFEAFDIKMASSPLVPASYHASLLVHSNATVRGLSATSNLVQILMGCILFSW